jgi:hypothetical protein
MTWHTTGDIRHALAHGYIGEAYCILAPLASAIREALTGRGLPVFRVIYYGERDDRMRRMFGYKDRAEMLACEP